MSSSEESNEEIEDKREENPKEEEKSEEEKSEEATPKVDLKLPIEDAGEGIKLEAEFLQKPFVVNDLFLFYFLRFSLTIWNASQLFQITLNLCDGYWCITTFYIARQTML